MEGTGPGWFPDPSGDYEVRWWDGQAWTSRVAVQDATFDDPLTAPDLPGTEQLLWEHGPLRLTTHRLWFPDPAVRSRQTEIPLWTVVRVSFNLALRADARGPGRVSAEVAYPGYVGPRDYAARKVPDAALVAANIGKWANRNRRAYRR